MPGRRPSVDAAPVLVARVSDPPQQQERAACLARDNSRSAPRV